MIDGISPWHVRGRTAMRGRALGGEENMGRVVYRPNHPKANENGMVPIEIAGPRHDGPVRNIISDDLPGGTLLNHADGKTYTSKAKFRAATRAANCVEVGNETQKDTRRWEGDVKRDIARSIEQLGG